MGRVTQHGTAGSAILDTGVTFADYFEQHAHHHREWVGGEVIQLTPAGLAHNEIIAYLKKLLDAYFELRAGGRALLSPFVLKLSDDVARGPDLMVVLDDNPHTLSETMMNGAADICIEVVSPESSARDRGVKFDEYEAYGVREYWLIDPLRVEARFYRLGEDARYHAQLLSPDDAYITPLLPQLHVHVPTLWTSPLPGTIAVASTVTKMLGMTD